MQSVDRQGREVDRRIESEAARRPHNVVVDRLGNADERNPLLVELVRDRQRTVATDADERIQFHLLEHLDNTIGVIEGALRRGDRLGERISAVDGAEDRSAQTQDAGDIARREDARLLGIDEPVEAVFQAHDLNLGVVRRLDDGADDCVETGRITAAGENADFLDSRHRVRLLRLSPDWTGRQSAFAAGADMARQPLLAGLPSRSPEAKSASEGWWTARGSNS